MGLLRSRRPNAWRIVGFPTLRRIINRPRFSVPNLARLSCMEGPATALRLSQPIGQLFQLSALRGTAVVSEVVYFFGWLVGGF